MIPPVNRIGTVPKESDDGLKESTVIPSKKPWLVREDNQLKGYVHAMPTQCRISWTKVSMLMGNRSAKQCRDRWFNYLRPNSNKGEWAIEEDLKVVELQSLYGNKWTMIASFLPGRSDYDIRRRWYSVSKSIWSRKEDDDLKRMVFSMPNIGFEMNDHWIELAKYIPNRSPKKCLDRWLLHLRPKEGNWTAEEDAKFLELHSLYGNRWGFISSLLPGRSEKNTQNRWHTIKSNNIDFINNTIMKAAKSQLPSVPIPQEANMQNDGTESLSVGVINELKNIPEAQTEGIDFSQDNTPTELSKLYDEYEEPSEDEPASFAYAVAYAAALINADDNEWLCYSSDKDDSDDDMLIQGTGTTVF